jgi:hypothetical protein
MRRQAWLVAFGLVVGIAGSAPAHASEIIDFGTGLAGAGGHMSYGGGNGPLVGSGILLGALTAVGTPSNEGVSLTSGPAACGFPSFCAQLDFTTGDLDSYSNGVYAFKPGGSFVITGGVQGTGITNQPLLWGSFTGDSVLDGGQLHFSATGNDNVSTQLLSYFGIAAGTSFEFVGSIIGANLGSLGSYNGGPFNVTAISSDISSVNTPEPASLALLAVGASLAGVRKLRRRRLATLGQAAA